MNKQKIMKKAVVLLFAALMIISSEAVMANTNISSTPVKQVSHARSSMVWDNNIQYHGALGGIIVSVLRPDGDATPADDFQFTTDTKVTGVFWQGGYFQCELAQGFMDYGFPWNIIFWTDDGSGNQPGVQIYNQTLDNASIPHTFWYQYTRPDTGREYYVMNYTATLPVPITFTANTKYWITVQGVGAYPPQACWVRHNQSYGGIQLHEAMFMGALWGYPSWVTLATLAPDLLPHDLNFQLFGGAPEDTTPPVTTCTLAGTMQGGVYVTDVTATLTATDDMSGVNYTMYKIDSGAWTTYTVPFVVTGNGAHTIHFYSVDVKGNIETEKTSTFAIQYPIRITIKGGFGITATIKNNGTAPLTGVSWTITLDGKLIFLGKTKSGTVDIAAGAEVKVKDMVFGFGKTNIAVSAGGVEASATGTVILFFVVGVA